MLFKAAILLCCVCVLNGAVLRSVQNRRQPRQHEQQDQQVTVGAQVSAEQKESAEQQNNETTQEAVPAEQPKQSAENQASAEDQNQQPEQPAEEVQSRFGEKTGVEIVPKSSVRPKLSKSRKHESDLSETSITKDYDFTYSVNDNFSGDIKSQTETRRGGLVMGSYSLVDSDGFRRIVDYKADDKNGFTAEIRREPVVVEQPEIPEPVPVAVQVPNLVLPPADEKVYRYVAPVFTSVTQIRGSTKEENAQQPQYDAQYIYNLPSDDAYYYLW